MRCARLAWLPVMVAVAAIMLVLVHTSDAALRPADPHWLEDAPPTYQGKSAKWWAKRAVQARKDANKRARTIRRLQLAQRRASAHFFDWLAAADCVQGKEAPWHHNGGTYDGGMQADADFQRTYAPDHLRRWGPAFNWPWWAQLEMAYRGWLFRGWEPWPNTARACGLR